MLLHARQKFPEAIATCPWPLALSYEAHLSNHLKLNNDGKCLMERLMGEELNFDLSNIHSFGCPVCFLDTNLQNN